MKSKLEDYYAAIYALNKSIKLNSSDPDVYVNRGNAKYSIGDKKGACDDFKKAISLGHKDTEKWFQTNGAAWCRDM